MSWQPDTTRASSGMIERARYLLKRGLDAAKDQSVLPVHAHAGAAGARGLSGGLARQADRSQPRARAGPSRRRQAGQPRNLLRAGRRPRGVRRAPRRRRQWRRDPRHRRPPCRDACRRPPLHRGPAQGARPLLTGSPLRRRHRRTARDRHGRTACGARAPYGDGVGRELDCRSPARPARSTSRLRSAIGTPRRRQRPSRSLAIASASSSTRRSRAVAPGQALVMYDGERVVGGGWID